MSEMIPLTATREGQLGDLLTENGLDHTDRDLVNIWSAPQNKFVQDDKRPPFLVHSGDVFQVPAPPLPRDAVLSEYVCTGSEKSADEAVAAIKAKHGEGALDEPTVKLEDFTTEYVLKLAHNQQFRIKRSASPPVPIQAGEKLVYPTRKRPAREHDASPATGLQDGKNVLPTGQSPFEVKVELTENGQILKLFDLVDQPETHPATASYPAPTGRWRVQPVKFKITLKSTPADAKPKRVVVRVVNNDCDLFFEEHTSGELLEPGEHIWAWDGFNVPAPKGADPDVGQANTRQLRGAMTVMVTAYPEVGLPGTGELHLVNRPAKAAFVDVIIDLKSSRATGIAYLSFNHALEDGGLWALTMAAAALVVAGALAVDAVAAAIQYGVQGRITDDQAKTHAEVLGGIAGGSLLLGTVLTASILGSHKLTDEEFTKLSGDILRGIEIHWSRHNLTVNGQPFMFDAVAKTEDGHDAVRFALMSPLGEQRACNLSLPFPFCPVTMPYSTSTEDNQETGAHEFGHSILREAFGDDWSTTHKGSSGGMLDQNANGLIGSPAPPAEVDLMHYRTGDGAHFFDITSTNPDGTPKTWVKNEAHYKAHIARSKAANVDVLGWIEIAQVEFREA
ncbi:MAG: hypothetical protein U0271_05535 [Polyangiaceae bacterium]